MAEESDDKGTPTPPAMGPASAQHSFLHVNMPSPTIEAVDFVESPFDEQTYRIQVRCIPASQSDYEVEEELHQQALKEGIELPRSFDEVEAITSSMSGTTILSENTNMQGSIMSQSTAPTSCSSSERRPVTSTSPPRSDVLIDSQPKATSDAQKKRNSIFRSRVRRIVGKKKRGSIDAELGSESNNVSDIQSPTLIESRPDSASPRSPASVRSFKSAWSNQVIVPKISYESEQDSTALKRSLENREISDLQKAQQAERNRFSDYRDQLLEQLRQERDDAKGKRKIVHDATIAEKRRMDDEMIEELEEAQLQEEMKMSTDHRFWERMMHSRLRQIERRVQHPTPPPTPGDMDPNAEDDETRDTPVVMLPVRPAAGPSEYNHLAEQYRQQTSLMQSHGGKINVLRGQQHRKMETFLAQKKDESSVLEQAHKSELDTIDEDFINKEKTLLKIFASKRALLELYWQKQALFEQQRQERATGLKHQLLPAATVGGR